MQLCSISLTSGSFGAPSSIGSWASCTIPSLNSFGDFEYNPVRYVTIPSTSDYEGIALTPEQALTVLEQLQQPEYMMIVLVAATGIRASEMLGLRWSDIVWGRS